LKYRGEIDGLRALAVVPVMLFHAGFELFGGGFVGVDVFFVISGYLITTILIEDIENKRFSIINFYERRARRILPALFFVIFVCIPFAWMWMDLSQMRDFSQSLVAVSLFASNILFWTESGYFAGAAEEKPLLHTWSLAVEEQYYLLFPIFLILAWRLGKNRVFWIIVFMSVLSLLLSEWGWRNAPIANFYLAPTRAWELLAGSIAAFVVQKQGVQKNNLLSLLGLTAIIFSIVAYDKNIPFPSVYTLVPVLGVTLIVLYAEKDTLVAKLLSTKLFVGIGLISYSAYLWHQPLFAFARITGNRETILSMILFFLSFVFAYLSWKYVENPFRNKSFVKRKTLFLGSLACILSIIFIGAIGHYSNGFSNRFDEKQITFLNEFENDLPDLNYITRTGLTKKYRLDCDYYDLEALKSSYPTNIPQKISPECTKKSLPQKTIFIWGDSHAQHFSYGLKKVYGQDFAIRQIATSGCDPKIVNKNSEFDYCQKSNFEAMKYISEVKPSTVLLAQRMNHNIGNHKELIFSLKRAGVSNIILVGPVPQWTKDLHDILVNDLDNVPKKLLSFINHDIIETNEELRVEFSSYPGVSYIDIIDLFCDQNGCLVYLGDDVEVGITTYDYGHLTPIASEYVAEKIRPYFTGANN
tara:strand:- start:7626 stop:9545 length:1920 start_codon:yes stop_codon:yes gene_type:complete